MGNGVITRSRPDSEKQGVSGKICDKGENSPRVIPPRWFSGGQMSTKKTKSLLTSPLKMDL